MIEPKDLILAAFDTLKEGKAMVWAPFLLGAAAGLAAWDLGSRFWPNTFEPRRPLIQTGH